jgi:hypothetical protein
LYNVDNIVRMVIRTSPTVGVDGFSRRLSYDRRAPRWRHADEAADGRLIVYRDARIEDIIND